MMQMLHPGAGGAGSMNTDLVLRSNCVRCGASASSGGELFAASCRHMTLCIACGRAMAEAAAPCTDCGVPVKTLIKEFKVKRHATGKQHFLGRFAQGLPAFSSVKNGVSWSMRKDIPRPTDPAREKFKLAPEKLKAKPWILEDDTGAHQFQGQHEGGQQAIYYILTKHGKDFHAVPAGSWYNFHKLVQYKQLTLEEAEEQMKNRRKTADGYQRWMMKAANTGAAAFGEVERAGTGGGGARKEAEGDESKRKTEKAGEDEELVKPEDFDPEDEVDRGDHWEHEETFTDDDEAVGNDPEEREEGPDVPAPPEIKQEEDELETEEGQAQEGAAGGLSQSGRDMKKLLGKAGGFEEEDDEEDEEDEDDDLDNEDLLSPVLAPKRKDGEVAETTPTKAANARPPGTSAAAKGKRKAGDEGKASGSAPKKSKTEAKKDVPSKKDAGKAKQPPPPTSASTAAGKHSVTEEEVKAALKQSGPLKSQDLVGKFKSRLRNAEEKETFAGILKKISRIQKRDGASFIVLKENY